MEEYRRIQGFIARMDTSDLDAMNVAAGQTRTDLLAFKDAINQLLSLWEGNAVAAPDIAPSEAVNRIRWIY
jgi:hypothetical protein